MAGEMASLWETGAGILNHSCLRVARVWEVETLASIGMRLQTFDLQTKKMRVFYPINEQVKTNLFDFKIIRINILFALMLSADMDLKSGLSAELTTLDIVGLDTVFTPQVFFLLGAECSCSEMQVSDLCSKFVS